MINIYMSNNDKYNNLIKLENEFDELISKYSVLHKDLMEDYTTHEKRLDDNYLDVNLNFKNNVFLYNTNKGILKYYPSSKSYEEAHKTCSEKSTLYFDYDFEDYDKIGEIVKTKDSTFYIGPNMKNEPCGFEGKNVYVSERDEASNINIGKMGYVNDDSSLSEYKKENIKYNNDYIKNENKTDNTNDLLQNPYILNNIDFIDNFNNVIDKCKDLCNEKENCGGFTIDKTINQCVLKDTNTYPYSGLEEKTNMDFYMRNKEPINHKSCNKEVLNINSKLWHDFYKSGTMTNSNVCNYEEYIKTKKEEVKELLIEINKIVMKITNISDNLSNEDINNLNTLGYSMKTLNDRIINFNQIKLNTDIDLTGKIYTSNQKTLQRQYFVYGLSAFLIMTLIVLYKVK